MRWNSTFITSASKWQKRAMYRTANSLFEKYQTHQIKAVWNFHLSIIQFFSSYDIKQNYIQHQPSRYQISSNSRKFGFKNADRVKVILQREIQKGEVWAEGKSVSVQELRHSTFILFLLFQISAIWYHHRMGCDLVAISPLLRSRSYTYSS